MRWRARRRTNAAPLFLAATAAYGANVALGSAVAARFINTRDFRWLHHALYIATCATTGSALAAGFLWARPRRASRRAALLLLPAAVPLSAIPYLGSRSIRHPLVALTAAPFIVAGLVRANRLDRK